VTIKKSAIFILLLSAFLFFRCSDEPTSIGKDLPGLNTINLITLNSSEDSLVQSSSYFHPKDVRLSSASSIMLGKSDNVTSSILIRFNITLPDSIIEDINNTSITVTNALMNLTQIYRFGEETAPFDFTVHKVTSNWSIDFTEDSVVQYDITDSKISADVNDSITTVNVNNQLLQDWLKISADTSLSGNYGIYIRPADNSQKILGYQAITQAFTNVPYIRVVIEKQGAYTDTLTFTSSADLSVVEGEIPSISNENILVRSGFVINSKLSFNLSPVPENTVVNKAELVLFLDTLETKVGTSYNQSLQAYFLFDSTNTDSISSSSISLSKSGNTFRGEITPFVRAWLNNNNNNGLLITTASPLNGVELFVIKGSAASLSNKPLLIITYTKLN
jgi:hypothetical protein